jgi:hypothetical protein
MVSSDVMIIAAMVSGYHGFGALKVDRFEQLILAVRDSFFLLRFPDESDRMLQVVRGLMATRFGIAENISLHPFIIAIQVLAHSKGVACLTIESDCNAPALNDMLFHRSVNLESSAMSGLLALFVFLLQLSLLVAFVYRGHGICSIPLVQDDFISGHSRLDLRSVFGLCQGIYVNRYLDTIAFVEGHSWFIALDNGRFWVREGVFEFSLGFHISIKSCKTKGDIGLLG